MKRYKGWLYSLMVIAFTLVILEIVSRSQYETLTTPTSRYLVEIARSDSFLGYDNAAGKPRFLPHPYMLYQLTPNYEGPFKTNSLGYRNREFNFQKDNDVIRVLTLGGSTTYGAPIAHQKDTWPSKLELLLNKGNMPSAKYEVINGGVDSASSAEILSGWIYKHRFLKPDIVILNMGINDIWPVLLSDKYDPSYEHFRKAQSYVKPSSLSKYLINNSYFYRAVWGNIFASTGGENDAGYPYTQVLDSGLRESEEKNGTVTKRISEVENIGFERNFELLIKLLKMDGIKVFVVMENSMNADNFKKWTSYTGSFFIRGLENPWLLAKAKNESIMVKISKRERVNYYKINNDDFEFNWYTDWYHLNAEGDLVKAQKIYKAMNDTKIVN